MKRKAYSIFLIIIFSGFSYSLQIINNGYNQNYLSKDILKIARYWDLTGSPIYIDDNDPSYNWAITAATNDWVNGSGTWNDPYTIENVTINGQNSGSCISVRDSSAYFIIKNSTLSNSGNNLPTLDSGINIQNTRNGFLVNNSIIANNGFGIVLEDANNFSVLNNVIISNDRSGVFMDTQYDNVNSNDNLIENNTISLNNEYGIYIDATWNPSVTDIMNNVIKKNTINFNGLDGIRSIDAESNSIIKNEIFNNTEDGIHIRDSNSLIIGNIIFNNTDFGIENYGYSNIIKDGNLFMGNSYGLRNVGDNTIIKDNNFTLNDLYGLVIISNSDNDIVSSNFFINNPINAYDYSSTTSWDNGSLGNYWDNYGGFDANDDGLGDTVFDVPPNGGSVDNYPLWEDGDDVGPNIVINAPIAGEIFGSGAPEFNINVIDQSLNTTWYTIDGGISNFTFTGITGYINQAIWDNKNSEVLTLRFYANDSVGNMAFIDVTIEKDILGPNITIFSPIANQIFGIVAPVFNVDIIDPNLHNKCYSLNGGENITFTTEIQFDQAEWDKIGSETASITFFANDTVGNENLTQILIQKDVYLPKIFINSPQHSVIFEDVAPTFNIEIKDPNLHEMWYTIDGGLTNTTFVANGTINQGLWNNALDGLIILTFYANDTAGNLNSTSVTIIKDTTVPIIEIQSPYSSNVYGQVSPYFNLVITEANLISTWYTLDGGIINTTFTELEGLINQVLWWDAPLGLITIRFYAIDISGKVGYNDVTMIKDIIELLSLEVINQSFAPDGFNLTFFIYNITGHQISNANIQIWWNLNDVSSDIINLGNGFYSISLMPITVLPGEEPILLNITVSATGYDDKYIEIFLAVDPEVINKENNVKTPENIFLVGIVIAVILTSGGLLITFGVVLLRKRKSL